MKQLTADKITIALVFALLDNAVLTTIGGSRIYVAWCTFGMVFLLIVFWSLLDKISSRLKR